MKHRTMLTALILLGNILSAAAAIASQAAGTRKQTTRCLMLIDGVYLQANLTNRRIAFIAPISKRIPTSQ